LICLAQCGGRTALRVPPPLPLEPECDVDEDCPGSDDLCAPVQCVDSQEHRDELPDLAAGIPLPPRVCIALDPVACDDGDDCTADSCIPESGECSYQTKALDLDGDGHLAPLPGQTIGDPGACGDDCNDASAEAYPGAEELCDGVDNDCNGIIDDGATFIPLQAAPTRISGNITPAGPGGLGYDGDSYMAIYTGTSSGFDMYASGLDTQGQKIAPFESQIALQNADSSGGPIVWIGDRYGLAWQDRRDGNYEAYFTLLNENGEKLMADRRLSIAQGFSVNVDLAWNGNQFIVAWQDNRNGLFEIFAQRLDVDGSPLGGNAQLSAAGGLEDESPTIAAGDKTVGLAYTNGVAGTQVVRFRTYEHDTLALHSATLTLSDPQNEAVYPTVVYNEDHYLVSWYVRSGANKAIFAASISEDGDILTPATAISAPGSFRSRHPTILPLGDRALFLYADDRDQNQGYELYSRMVDSSLSALTDERRLTTAAFDSIYPRASFGPDGDVGVLFRDDREAGAHHVWFTRLGCVAGN
jgi:hypothetical protein